MTNEIQHDIDQLNSFLRGERSAVETYDQAIEKMDDAMMRQQLEFSRSSHAQRVQKLSARITSLGGVPSNDSGVWGTFTKIVEGGAKVFGKKAAIAALEEGEDHGVKDYSRDLDDLSPPTRQFVLSELVPEQRRTHEVLSSLKHAS